jgi:hypothetical protein
MFKSIFGPKQTPKPIPRPVPAAHAGPYHEPAPQHHPASVRQIQNSQQQHQPSAPWSCPACTFVNQFDSSSCAMCGTSGTALPAPHFGSQPHFQGPESSKLADVPVLPLQRSVPHDDKAFMQEQTHISSKPFREAVTPARFGGQPPSQHLSAPQSGSRVPNNDVLNQLRRNVEEYSAGQRLSQQPQLHANVHASVVFPNGECFEQSLIVPVSEVEHRLSSLFVAAPPSTPTQRGKQSTPLSTENGTQKVPASGLENGSFPRYDSQTGFDNMRNAFQETFANAGAAGGERIPYRKEDVFTDARVPLFDDLSRPDGQPAVTPQGDRSAREGALDTHQRGHQEKITLAERNRQLEEQRLQDSGGSRVNQTSRLAAGKRLYSLENYETSVYIDPTRHLQGPQVESRDVNRDEEAAANLLNNNVGVPVEVASVAAKMRNMHRVAGERIKEMDHFVASVSTPIVKLSLPGTNDASIESSGNGAAKRVTRNDIGVYLQASFKKTGLERSALISVPVYSYDASGSYDKSCPLLHFGSRPFQLMVEGQYCRPDTPNPCPEHVLRYATIFYWLLEKIFSEVLHIELSPRTVQLYYMTTIRADELVCSLSEDDKKIYLNVLVFQQSLCCELKPMPRTTQNAMEQDDPALHPTGIQSNKLREQLSSWLNRVITAVYHKQRDLAAHNNAHADDFVVPPLFNTEVNKRNGFGDASRGLYDKIIRARFYELLLQLASMSDTASIQRALTAYDEGVAIMSTPSFQQLQQLQRRNNIIQEPHSMRPQTNLLSRCQELFSQALAESREREDIAGEKAAQQRLDTLGRLQSTIYR